MTFINPFVRDLRDLCERSLENVESVQVVLNDCPEGHYKLKPGLLLMCCTATDSHQRSVALA